MQINVSSHGRQRHNGCHFKFTVPQFLVPLSLLSDRVSAVHDPSPKHPHHPPRHIHPGSDGVIYAAESSTDSVMGLLHVQTEPERAGGIGVGAFPCADGGLDFT